MMLSISVSVDIGANSAEFWLKAQLAKQNDATIAAIAKVDFPIMTLSLELVRNKLDFWKTSNPQIDEARDYTVG